MAVEYELKSVERNIFKDETFHRTIHREDDAAFDANDTGTFEIREYLSKDVLSTGTMVKAGDSKSFAIDVLDTTSWALGKKYELLGRILNSTVSSNDVVYQVIFTVV